MALKAPMANKENNMKKQYSKPFLEVEVYQLAASIAANCGTVVSLGPEADGKTTCAEYDDGFQVTAIHGGMSLMAQNGTPFYADGSANCNCYYSSGDYGYFTS